MVLWIVWKRQDTLSKTIKKFKNILIDSDIVRKNISLILRYIKMTEIFK